MVGACVSYSTHHHDHGFVFMPDVQNSSVVPSRRIADRVAATLLELGVEVVFGLPGGAISPLYDALAAYPGVRMVIAKTEHGAITAASAYARYTGKVGLVLVTSGPGVLNALNGLASAQREGIPIVLIGGDVSRSAIARNAVQDGSAHGIGMVSVTRPLCTAVFDIHRTGLADASVRQAFVAAKGRRPGSVYVNFPMDVGLAPDTPGSVSSERMPADELVVTGAIADRVARALSAAERPLFIVGNGARSDHAGDVLLQVAERFGVPVATTPKGKGVFPESHRLALGVFGHGGHASASDYVAEAPDVIVVLGSSMNDAATHGWNPKLQAPMLVQVDVDPLQIGRNYAVAIGVNARVGTFLEALRDHAPRAPRDAAFGVTRERMASRENHLAPHDAIAALQERLSADTMFTCDIGEHLMFVTHYLKVEAPDAYFVMTGHASMGTAIASAVGLALAAPQRHALAFCGDGGFVMSIADLALAVQEKLPIVVAVFNDFRYAMVELGHKKVYGRALEYPLAWLDVSKLAEGCGASCVVCATVDDIRAIDFESARASGPLVLDIRIDPTIAMKRVDRFEKPKDDRHE